MPRSKTKDIATNLPPIMRHALELVNVSRMTQGEITDRAGVGRQVISNWRSRGGASVSVFEAVLNVLGHRLAVVPEDVTDEEITAAVTMLRRDVARQDSAPKADPTPSVGHKTRQADTPLSAYISDEISG